MIPRFASKKVTFNRPFLLPGMDAPHAPGTFEVTVEEEQLDLMWDARMSITTIMLRYPGRVEALQISARALEEAQLRDLDSAAG